MDKLLRFIAVVLLSPLIYAFAYENSDVTRALSQLR